jgi:catechol 2,3-dioxygenase-like lactoylglutathione lyase family enzyme
MRVVLNVADFDAVVGFYRGVMAFDLVGGWDRGPADRGALVEVTSGAVVEIVGRGPSFSTPRYHDDAIAIELEDRAEVDHYSQRLLASGVQASAPMLHSWGHYSTSLRDPVDLEIVLYVDESAAQGRTGDE